MSFHNHTRYPLWRIGGTGQVPDLMLAYMIIWLWTMGAASLFTIVMFVIIAAMNGALLLAPNEYDRHQSMADTLPLSSNRMIAQRMVAGVLRLLLCALPYVAIVGLMTLAFRDRRPAPALLAQSVVLVISASALAFGIGCYASLHLRSRGLATFWASCSAVLITLLLSADFLLAASGAHTAAFIAALMQLAAAALVVWGGLYFYLQRVPVRDLPSVRRERYFVRVGVLGLCAILLLKCAMLGNLWQRLLLHGAAHWGWR